MNKDVCFELGYIIKKHGLQGELSIFLDTDNPENYTSLESVFVEIDEKLVPFFIDTIKVQGGKAIIKFEGVEDAEHADELKGSKIFLPLELLPPLKGKSFYYHEVIHFDVVDKNVGLLGPVDDIIEAGPQQLFSIRYKGKEVLVPVNDQILLEIDRADKIINIDLPDGLLEIYLD